MSDLIIEDVDPDTLEFLRRRAAALGRSVEVAEEILRSLTRLSPPSPEDASKISGDELHKRQRSKLSCYRSGYIDLAAETIA
jgi:plasmid stability protein